MTEQTCDAFLLHRHVFSEWRVELTFLTREYGVLKARFKGNQRQQAMLQPFKPLWLSVSERSFGYALIGVEPKAASYLFSNLTEVPALYVNELFYRFFRAGGEDVMLFDLYESTLMALTHTHEWLMLERILRRLELQILAISGSLVSLQQEAMHAKPIRAEAYYELIPSQGFRSAETGFLGEHLIAISEDRWDDEAVLKTAKRLMRMLIQHALQGASVKTRDFYRDWMKQFERDGI